MLSKRILEAVLSGIIQALTDLDDEEVHVGRTGNIQPGKEGEHKTIREYSFRMNKRAIDQAVECYNKYGILYNPHLDGKDFKKFIQWLIGKRGEKNSKANLNWIDTSEVTNMSYLFASKDKLLHMNEFNGDISKWNVSNVKDMEYMFAYSKFNGDISNWDVSNANVYDMFLSCPIKEEYKPKFN